MTKGIVCSHAEAFPHSPQISFLQVNSGSWGPASSLGTEGRCAWVHSRVFIFLFLLHISLKSFQSPRDSAGYWLQTVPTAEERAKLWVQQHPVSGGWESRPRLSVQMGACACDCECLWRPEVSSWMTLHLSFWDGLSEPGNHWLGLLDWLASNQQNYIWFCIPSSSITMYCYIWVFTQVPGIQAQDLWLKRQALYWLVKYTLTSLV